MALKSVVKLAGKVNKGQYPCVKKWCGFETYALFSSAHDAVIIAVAENHHDYVGQKVEDFSDANWELVQNYEICIKDF